MPSDNQSFLMTVSKETWNCSCQNLTGFVTAAYPQNRCSYTEGHTQSWGYTHFFSTRIWTHIVFLHISFACKVRRNVVPRQKDLMGIGLCQPLLSWPGKRIEIAVTEVKDSLIWCPREFLIGRQVILHLMMACLRRCADLASQVSVKNSHPFVSANCREYGTHMPHHQLIYLRHMGPLSAIMQQNNSPAQHQQLFHFTTLFMRKKKCYGNWQNSTMMSNLLSFSVSYNHDKVRSIFRNTRSKKRSYNRQPTSLQRILGLKWIGIQMAIFLDLDIV